MRFGVPFSQYGKVYQYKKIAPGKNDRVFYLKIPSSCVGFIYKIASNWFTNTKYKFIVDGEVVEQDIERVLGAMDNPKVIDPPIVVENYIEVIAENNDNVEHLFEVFCDGVLYIRR